MAQVIATGLRRPEFLAPVNGPGFTTLSVIDARGASGTGLDRTALIRPPGALPPDPRGIFSPKKPKRRLRCFFGPINTAGGGAACGDGGSAAMIPPESGGPVRAACADLLRDRRAGLHPAVA